MKFFLRDVIKLADMNEQGNYIGAETPEYLAGKIKQLENVNHIIAHNLRGAGANIKLLADILMLKMARMQVGDNTIPAVAANDEFAATTADEFTTAQAITYIQESTDSFLATLNTLMEVAEADLNTGVQYEDCDIKVIIAGIVGQLHGFVHQRKAVIDLDLGLPVITYPRAYMESMLYNFINNALKYARPNVPLKIRISTRMEKGRQVISVKDNGLGIDMNKYSARIFQLNQVFHSGYESKGIGLYITRTQIEAMGGTIMVKSVVDEGSEFIVVL